MSFNNPRRGMPLGNIGRYSIRLLYHSVLSLYETSSIVNTILTLHHTILTFYDLKETTLENTVGKTQNAGNIYIYSITNKRYTTQKYIYLENTVGKTQNAGNKHFPKVFSTLSKKEILILETYNLSSATASNWSSPNFCCLVKG